MARSQRTKCRWKTLSAVGMPRFPVPDGALPQHTAPCRVSPRRCTRSAPNDAQPLLLRYRASGYRLTPHMVLVVSNTLQYLFGRMAYFSPRRRTGPDNRQVVEGVLRHISKTPPATPAARNNDRHRSRHLSSSSQAKPRPHRNGFVVTKRQRHGRIVSQQRGNKACRLASDWKRIPRPTAVKR